MTETNQRRTGVPIGYQHDWDYTNARWKEEKTTDNQWEVDFSSIKRSRTPKAEGYGPPAGYKVHWLLLCDQVVEKIDKDSYNTHMTGTKIEIGHKMPYWKAFSNEYPNNKQNEATGLSIYEWAEKYLRTLTNPCMTPGTELKLTDKACRGVEDTTNTQPARETNTKPAAHTTSQRRLND